MADRIPVSVVNDIIKHIDIEWPWKTLNELQWVWVALSDLE